MTTCPDRNILQQRFDGRGQLRHFFDFLILYTIFRDYWFFWFSQNYVNVTFLLPSSWRAYDASEQQCEYIANNRNHGKDYESNANTRNTRNFIQTFPILNELLGLNQKIRNLDARIHYKFYVLHLSVFSMRLLNKST